MTRLSPGGRERPRLVTNYFKERKERKERNILWKRGRELGIIVVAIKRQSGEMKFNPIFQTIIGAGNTLIAVGEKSKLKMLEDMAVSRK